MKGIFSMKNEKKLKIFSVLIFLVLGFVLFYHILPSKDQPTVPESQPIAPNEQAVAEFNDCVLLLNIVLILVHIIRLMFSTNKLQFY